MSLWKYVALRGDVFDRKLDEAVAPSLSEVVTGRAHRVYSDPREFVGLTYPTTTIRRLVKEVLEAFAARTGRVVVLPSAFGGGKTHAMLLLYHLASAPELVGELDPSLRDLGRLSLRDVKVVVVDGTDRRTAPSPLEPLEEGALTVRTLWGYLAHRLGVYEVVRRYDEVLIAPERETLSRVLSNKNVLVLVDELGVYYSRLSRAPRPEEAEWLRSYLRQVVLFLRLLAECSKEEGATTVVVISVPAEVTERGLRAEPGYEDFVRELEREVLRVAVVFEKPIATDEDFAKVLVRRLFSRVDGAGASAARSKLAVLHRDFKDLVKDLSEEVGAYYPFHPLYVYVLRELVERNKDLQRTRDALRISRKVLRSMSERAKSALLVMPVDIDPRVEELRPYVVTSSYSGFDLVLSKIAAKAREIPVPEDMNPEVYRDAAFRLALYAFLRTYLYDPGLEPRKEFPSKTEIITGVYDPARYEQYLLSPSVLSELLDSMASGGIESRVPHLYSGEGYYWVTRLLDLRERVEKEAERVDDLTAKQVVLESMESLCAAPYEAKERAAEPRVFRSKHVLAEPGLVSHDGQSYVLVVVASPIEGVRHGAYTSGTLYEMVFYKTDKSQRRYANTVAVLLSSRSSKWEELVKIAKMLVACGKVLDELKRDYRDKRILKLLEDDLDRIKKELAKRLRYKIVAEYFDSIAYPSVDKLEGVPVRVVKVAPVRDVAGRTLIELAEQALKFQLKVLDEKHSRSFDVIATLVARAEGREEGPRWTKEVALRDLKSYFSENPGLPMVNPQELEEAVLSGLVELKIGVARGDRVFYKKVEGAEDLGRLQDTDLIVPADVALEKQLEALSRVEEEVLEDAIVRRYYVVEKEGKLIPVGELKSVYPDIYRDVFLGSRVRLHVERIVRGFDLRVVPERLEYRLDEAPSEVEVRVLAKGVGGFETPVRVEVSSGRVEPDTVVPDQEVRWTLPLPRSRGVFRYEVRASSIDGKLARRASLEVVLEPGLACREEPTERLLRLELAASAPAQPVLRLLELVGRYVTGAKVVRSCELKISFGEDRAAHRAVEVKFTNASTSDVLSIVRALRGVLGLTATMEFVSLKLEVQGDGMVESIEEFKKDLESVKGQLRVKYCY